ncbi:hypothetical protein [Serratia microhaemolytica]|uniref:hypothetical protein n=1 Tax=Serratia microhaemolytica TaxID=2675110 RepID=UPI000FDD8090|nr:hypothetical protein [Serratia microhaemolytica]
MKCFISMFFMIILSISSNVTAAVNNKPSLAEENMLFMKNKASFNQHDLLHFSSRSFKFLAIVPDGKTAEETILFYRDIMIKKANEKGYSFTSGKKDLLFKIEQKHFLDTKDKLLDQQHLVIRQNYSQAHDSAITEKSESKLTVKKIAKNTPVPIIHSSLFTASNASNIKQKTEENISADQHGELQSYFEVTLSSKLSENMLKNNSINDYFSIHPELAKFGIAKDEKLIRQIAYSTQMSPGKFTLPNGKTSSFDIEVWASTPDGKPILVELAFDSEGYASSVEDLTLQEEFFVSAVLEGMHAYALPDATLMGSKLRALKAASEQLTQ